MKAKSEIILPEILLTKPEVARRLRRSPRSIEHLVAARALECVKFGRSIRFRPEAVAEFIRDHTVTVH